MDNNCQVLRTPRGGVIGQGESDLMHRVRHAYVRHEGSPLRGSCPESLNDLADKIDYGKLYEALNSEETLNPGIHEGIRCVVQSVISKEGNPGINLGRWIERSNQQPIKYGKYKKFALSLGTSQDEEIVLIKTAENKDKDIPHEAYIGLYVINEIRQKIPNFAFTYGYELCDKYKKGRNICSKTGKYSYLITENILHAKTLGSFFEQDLSFVRFVDIVKILAQLIGAVLYAEAYSEFKHNSLGLDNIFVRYFNEEILVSSYIRGGNMYALSTQYVPYITDFSTASVIRSTEEHERHLYESKIRGLRDYTNDTYRIIRLFIYAVGKLGNSASEDLITLSKSFEANLHNSVLPHKIYDSIHKIIVEEGEEYEYIGDEVYTDCNFIKRFVKE